MVMKRTCKGIQKFQYPLCVAALGLCLASPAFAQDDKDKDKDKPAAGAPARREESMRASVTAKVTAINPEKREITLRGPEGKEKTLTVDKSVQRFDEIKVGADDNSGIELARHETNHVGRPLRFDNLFGELVAGATRFGEEPVQRLLAIGIGGSE